MIPQTVHMLIYKIAIANGLRITQKLPIQNVEKFDDMIRYNDKPMNNNFRYLFTQLITQLTQIYKKTDIAMAKWEKHFNKLQQGLIFDESNPDVIEKSENENYNKKLLQNDVDLSQNKLYKKHKIHSLDECAENMIKKLLAIPKHANNNTGKKTLDAQPGNEFFFYETHKTKTQNKKNCQNMCLCNQKYIWDSNEKNITDWGSWEKCDHCKRNHELYLNYNSINSFSLWADMMKKDLEWNKQQYLADENQEATHNIEF